jgi:hypothetical protein
MVRYLIPPSPSSETLDLPALVPLSTMWRGAGAIVFNYPAYGFVIGTAADSDAG